jgi:hypothetical protein
MKLGLDFRPDISASENIEGRRAEDRDIATDQYRLTRVS